MAKLQFAESDRITGKWRLPYFWMETDRSLGRPNTHVPSVVMSTFLSASSAASAIV
jgi:hypothetical protein